MSFNKRTKWPVQGCLRTWPDLQMMVVLLETSLESRVLRDLGNQKPQTQSPQSPAAFKQLLPLLLDHALWHITISWCSDHFRPSYRSQYFAFNHTSQPGRGLEWPVWICATPELLCGCVWHLAYDNSIFAGLTAPIYQLTKPLCGNQWDRSVFHLAQWPSYDSVLAFVCLGDHKWAHLKESGRASPHSQERGFPAAKCCSLIADIEFLFLICWHQTKTPTPTAKLSLHDVA